MYIVYGGIYTDTNFEKIIPETDEKYGPFDTYEEALNVWRGKMGWNVDNCMHRLRILDFTCLQSTK